MWKRVFTAQVSTAGTTIISIVDLVGGLKEEAEVEAEYPCWNLTSDMSLKAMMGYSTSATVL
jgi:hypothetical protein